MQFRIVCWALGAYLASGLIAGEASALSYRLVDAQLPGCGSNCPKVVVATGTIRSEEHFFFTEFMKQAMETERVSNLLVIDSPGGFVVGSQILGYLLRQLKMTVIVGRWTGDTITPSNGLTSGTCASACVFTLSGGTKRHYVAGSRIGVHRQHTGRQVLDPLTRKPVNASVDYESGFELYRKFFGSLGLDGSGIVAKLSRTPSEEMYWFAPGELQSYRIATDVSATVQPRKRKRN